MTLPTTERIDPEPRTHTLGAALGAALGATAHEVQNSLVGRVIGNYQLVSVLGRGGAGTVYLGERADRQFSAQVAIKVVDRAASADLGMRFRAERQILASLNHPNIARLIDAGETEDGQPYLVMEYVQGQPLDRYCDQQRLDLHARLALFIDICAAVQYAHQNLIIHRDLKPANILVTPEGVPKLLDFGIAKLLNAGDMAGLAELTRMNDRLLTPEYASPEQILGAAVTTASDVYSLGIVLYRLLTGLRPYELPADGSQLELERSICAADPLRPSAAILRAMEASPMEGEHAIATIALARGLSPDRLRRRLLGDIDSIIARALRKEPEHRYSSVERLVADIRCHLSNEAVQARQGNWLYYSQRFVRRHTTAVAASAGFVIFVIAVAVVMSVQRQNIAIALDRATHDRERAEKVSQFMLDVFSAADPFTNFGREPTARILLDQAARHIQSDLNQQPEVRARLLEAIGRSYRRMGQPDRAVAYLKDSLHIQQQLPADDEAAIGSIVTEIAIALRQEARIDESDRHFSEALEISRRSKDQRSAAHAQLLVDLGRLEKMRSNTEQALGHLTEALQLMRQLKGPEDPEVGAILAEMSNIMVWSDDLEGAEQAARQAVEIYKALPEYHPDRVMADYYLADILFYRGRVDDAASLFECALSAQRRLYGPANSTVADTLASLAQVRLAQRKTGEAEKLIREALAAHRDSASTAYQKIGYLQTMLATVLIRQVKFADAERLLRDTLDLFAKNLPPDHQYVASTEHYLGEALLAQKKFRDAEVILTSAMSRWKRTGAPAWRSARSGSALGEALYRQGRTEAAERYLVASYRELTADPAADRDSKHIARERIARFYTDLGQRQKLDALTFEAESPARRRPGKAAPSMQPQAADAAGVQTRAGPKVGRWPVNRLTQIHYRRCYFCVGWASTPLMQVSPTVTAMPTTGTQRLLVANCALIALAISGCASMNESECLTVDWRTIGYEDGAAGYSADRIAQHRKACAKHGVSPDLALYQSGRSEGLYEYCQPANGYRLGVNGSGYNGICPAELDGAFVSAYESGRQLYTLQVRVSDAASQLDAKRRELNRVEDEIVRKSALIVSSDSSNEDRAQALIDAKQLAERVGRLKAEIVQLEKDRARYERDLEDYRATASLIS